MHSSNKRLRPVPRIGIMELAISIWIVCTVLSLVAAQGSLETDANTHERRLAQSDSQYFLSRAARFGQKSETGEGKSVARAYAEIVPREYRFYTGSRYGKRSVRENRRRPSHPNDFDVVLDYLERIKYDMMDMEQRNMQDQQEQKEIDVRLEEILPAAFV